jgi:protein-S-isoprenylcysteine O-methyltransferase Ste14
MARINAEERLLQAEFGAPYDAWRARTARLVPGLARFQVGWKRRNRIGR